MLQVCFYAILQTGGPYLDSVIRARRVFASSYITNASFEENVGHITIPWTFHGELRIWNNEQLLLYSYSSIFCQ